jgi:hypothetical protein
LRVCSKRSLKNAPVNKAPKMFVIRFASRNAQPLKLCLAFVVIAILPIYGCKEAGFRNMDDTRHHASTQIAREVLSQIQEGLKLYHDEHRSYPTTNETHLYDSIHNYLKEPMDPAQLYHNDGGTKGFYIAIGGRNNRVIYRYPPTVGPTDYTLYWSGPNGVDEEGEGDDLPSWDTSLAGRFERRKLVDLRADGSPPVEMLLVKTGSDLFKDSVRFTLRDKDSTLFRDVWPLRDYFKLRPDLTERDRARTVREELQRFFNTSEFVHTDSLLQQDWLKWADLKPQSPEALEISHKNLTMFNYYTGAGGSRGIVWSPVRKRIIRVWKSN